MQGIRVCGRTLGAGKALPDRAGQGTVSARAPGVSTADQGGAAAGPPDFGMQGFARTVFTLSGRYVAMSGCGVRLGLSLRRIPL